MIGKKWMEKEFLRKVAEHVIKECNMEEDEGAMKPIIDPVGPEAPYFRPSTLNDPSETGI